MANTVRHTMQGTIPLRLNLQAGFTLIEVLIAITIFAIGILAVVTMQTTSIGGNSKSRKMTEQTSWASDRVEQVTNMNYAALIDGAGTNAGLAGLEDGGITPATIADNGPIVSPDGAYSIYWNVAEDQPIINAKTIKIIVTHNAASTPPVTIDFMKVIDL